MIWLALFILFMYYVWKCCYLDEWNIATLALLDFMFTSEFVERLVLLALIWSVHYINVCIMRLCFEVFKKNQLICYFWKIKIKHKNKHMLFFSVDNYKSSNDALKTDNFWHWKLSQPGYNLKSTEEPFRRKRSGLNSRKMDYCVIFYWKLFFYIVT